MLFWKFIKALLSFSGILRTVLAKMHFWIFKNAFYKYYEFCGYRKEGDLFEFSKKAFHKYQRCASTGRGWTFMDFQKYIFTKLRIYLIKNRGGAGPFLNLQKCILQILWIRWIREGGTFLNCRGSVKGLYLHEIWRVCGYGRADLFEFSKMYRRGGSLWIFKSAFYE